MERHEKQWKGRWNYKPGRTPEELEDERRRAVLCMSYTERFALMRHLMNRQIVLRQARLRPANLPE